MEVANKNITNELPQLNGRLIALMAAASGIAVANIYYIQPLLDKIADYYHITQASAGLLATLTQTGYALGLFLILPLADLIERKKLILIMLFLSALSLLVMYFSSNFELTAVACLAIGTTSVIPQLLLPLCAKLSNETERGKNIGHIMSGLLIGVLLSRVISGIIGKYFDWRTMYIIAVFFMIGLFVVLKVMLPICEANVNTNMNYISSLKSMNALPKKFPVIKEAAINGAMILGAFSALWTTLTFQLQSSAFNFDTNIVGMFGLLGVTGAMLAPLAGKLSDKKGAKFTVGVNIAVIFVSYLCFIAFGFQVWGLILGVILLDMGVNSCNVANQTRIQRLSEEARNRITSIYMVSLFLGGAVGSYLGALMYNNFGWYGFCTIGIITQVIAAFVHVMTKKKF
ncbi:MULTISPECIES: MFS transporter [unclassified Clostridium]|uniref:MFS transporter n=1 Tax=unclassified Clostridium TaxID=2614128 RepID=UPI000297820A|nr:MULTISPECIES: MFS transporter [unclassified Clostridium]EKQ51480.1 MAG: arabinose efflux permease family protein [Clostridium sp. Maddingley MBC34-26]